MKALTGREQRELDLKLWYYEHINKIGGNIEDSEEESKLTRHLIQQTRDFLEDYRKRHGYNKVEFSRLLRINRTNYDKYLKPTERENVTLSTIVKLAYRLGFELKFDIAPYRKKEEELKEIAKENSGS